MGKALFQSDRQNTDTTSVRRWISSWVQGMLDAGFVQTADTGQVDPETVAADTGLQYAMFRFDDSFQATHPIFFKVGFRTETSGTLARQAITIAVGKATDGAGVLSGILLAETAIGSTSTSSGVVGVASSAWEHVASSGPGWAALIPFVRKVEAGTGSHLHSGFIIERARSASGALRGDGLLVAFPAPNSSTNSITLTSLGNADISVNAIAYETGLVTTGIPPVISAYSIGGSELGSGGSLASGSIGPVFPWDVVAPGLAPWRSCVIVSIPGADLPGDVFQTSLCGEIGLFFPIAPSEAAQSRWGLALEPASSASANKVSRRFGAGIRWED